MKYMSHLISVDSVCSDVVFETQRLLCRRLTSTDSGSLHDVYSDVEAVRWVGDGVPLSPTQCEEWIRVTERNYLNRGYGMFALELSASKQVVGFCGIIHPNGQADAEVKYAFLRKYWGIGLATEAIRALLNYAKSHHQLSLVIATVAAENTASQNVLIKAGMKFVCTRTDENGMSDNVYEWRAKPNPSLEHR